MRILMISQSLYGDGIGTVTYNLYNSLKKHNHKVDVACFKSIDSNSTQAKDIRNNGDRIFHIKGLKENGVVKYIISIRKICKQNKYDVIHIHTGIFAWISAIGVWPFLVKKRVAHAHGKTTNLSEKKQKIIVGPFRILNNLICNGFVGCSLESNIFAYGKKGILIPNYVNCDNIFSVSKDRIDCLRKSLASDEAVLFGFMGNIDDNKNVIFLPDVLLSLRKSGIPAEFFLMGNGIRFNDVKNKVGSYGLDNYFHMLGRIDNCNEIIQTMDYYISASKSEGMSMSILEAQMSGVPCIVSNNISNDSDLKIGLFHQIDTYDADYWAKAIYEIHQKGIRKISREKAYKNICQRGYDENSIVNKLLKVYNNDK